MTPIVYPKPDGVLTFDRLSSVFLSNTNHEEDQPGHLKVQGHGAAEALRARRLCAAPRSATARRASTSGSRRAAASRFQINAQNCVHCKTCDIKDPNQNITWVTPEGGGGPNYVEHVRRRRLRAASGAERQRRHHASVGAAGLARLAPVPASRHSPALIWRAA